MVVADGCLLLEAELGAAPVAALGVVADGVVSAHPDPVRDGPVLPLLLRQLLLDHESLVGRLNSWEKKIHRLNIPESTRLEIKRGSGKQRKQNQ